VSVDQILHRQAGVITRGQALAAGLSTGAIEDRLRRRRWRPLHPQVYLAAGCPRSGEVAVRAAVLWAGADAVLGGAAAAWWHGLLADPPRTVGVIVPARRLRRAPPGIRVRCRRLAAADRAEERGLRVAAPALAVLEAAVELGPEGAPLLDRALQRGLRFADVCAAHRRALGSPGSAAAGRLLAAAAERSTVAAGRLLRQRLREAGVTGWYAATAGGVTFPAARLVVEVTGWAGPPGAAAGRRPGWVVQHVDWTDLTGAPGTVPAGLRSAAPASPTGSNGQ
jgi:hypothetical protein